MKTITIDGVKHHFNWDASDRYVSEYRSMINAQKKPTHDPVDAYRCWHIKNRGKQYPGRILKTQRDYNNYLQECMI